MQTYTILQRGHQHKHFCEDFLLQTSIGEEWQIAVVADGCSGGKDSHFASTLSCKLMRKVAEKEEFVQKDFNAKSLGISLLLQFMKELKQTQLQLDLSTEELLSTLLLMVYNKRQAWVSVLGDGVVAIDERIHIIDQNNTPDYPAYHVKEEGEILKKYLTKNSFKVQNPKELVIATDGILSFVSNQGASRPDSDWINDYLLCDRQFAQHSTMLNRKCNILRTKYRLVNMDDLAIVRYCNK
ncbi:MAG: protein phosphatase 2C domain-containing protein [Chitinophagales bacterium]